MKEYGEYIVIRECYCVCILESICDDERAAKVRTTMSFLFLFSFSSVRRVAVILLEQEFTFFNRASEHLCVHKTLLPQPEERQNNKTHINIITINNLKTRRVCDAICHHTRPKRKTTTVLFHYHHHHLLLHLLKRTRRHCASVQG